MKKIIITILCVLLCASLFTACKKNTELNPTISLNLNKDSITLYLNETEALVAEVSNTDGLIEWTSSDSAIASVENGVVTALGEGTATIVATVGDVTASCVVTVIKSNVFPVLFVDVEELSININGSASINATLKFNLNSIDNAVITFASSDTAVAEVNSAGTVTGKAVGTAIITVSCTYNQELLQKEVCVTVT